MALPPKKAFILAAGKGERMRPLTDTRPKPMIEVAGRTMLDRCLDALEAVGVEEVVINLHYLGHVIEEHLKNRKTPKIIFSHEDQLLDTGGGVKKYLEFFGNEPFYALNADIVWTDGPGRTALERLADRWNPAEMDVLLLLHDTAKLPDYAGPADYLMEPGAEKPIYAKGTGKANFIFAGPRIVHPRSFEGSPDGAFSFLDIFHKAERSGRLFALRHDGEWHHVGTPEALEQTNQILAVRKRKLAP